MWFRSGRSAIARIAGQQLEVRAADLHPAVAGRREAERLPPLDRLDRIRGHECNVVEVELRIGFGFDQHDLEALAQIDSRVATVQRRDAQADPRERPALPRAFRIEERELAAARVGAEQGEAIGLLDHAHAEPVDGHLGHPVAVCDPERDVIESPRIHLARIAVGSLALLRVHGTLQLRLVHLRAVLDTQVLVPGLLWHDPSFVSGTKAVLTRSGVPIRPSSGGFWTSLSSAYSVTSGSITSAPLS